MTRDANEIAREYSRKHHAGGLLPPPPAPRVGTLSVWLDGNLERDPDFEFEGVRAQVNGPVITATAPDTGTVEVIHLPQGGYACFVHDDDAGE